MKRFFNIAGIFNNGSRRLQPALAVILFLTIISAGKPAVGAASPVSPNNPGLIQPATFAELQHHFSEPDMLFAPFIFWFWDESIDAGKMAGMARTMLSQNLNPGYAHGRSSIVGDAGLPDEQWLSPLWFDAFGGALKQAEDRHGYLGYVDEYMWPCLQAKGRVVKTHPELKTETLSWQTIDAHGGAEVKVPASFFTVAARLAEPLPPGTIDGKPHPQAKTGAWIWNPVTANNQTCRFIKTFDLPEGKTVQYAQARATADNSYKIFLDGELVGQGKNWEVVDEFDITSRLKPGRHTLAIEAFNADLAAGLTFGLRAELESGQTFELASDATWLVTVAGAPGWEKPGFAPTGWVAAKEIAPANGGPWQLSQQKMQKPHQPRRISSQGLKVIGAGEPFVWTAPAGGDWRVYVFSKYDHNMVNYLDERLADAFIKIALEPYDQRFGPRMGKSIPGDFMDNEGEYGKLLAWSGSLDQRYHERYNRDIRESMPLLLDEDSEGLYARARCEWFALVSDLYSGTFRRVSDWHAARGMYTTGHFWEESLPAQVRWVGDNMNQQRAFIMPGQDCLQLKALEVHDFMEAGSVAQFEGARFMTELMGAGGWDTFTPSLLKQCTNAVITWGVSHVIPHGVFANRHLDGTPWSPDWYNENPMFPWLHLWADFTRRACYLNAHGRQAADVLLYYPIETAWALSAYEIFDPNLSPSGIAEFWTYPGGRPSGERINQIDKIYSQAEKDLTDARIEYLIGDHHYLGQMEAIDGRLVRGDFSFGAIVLPPLEVLPLPVAERLVAFAKGGGRVYALGELPAGSVENGMRDPHMAELMKTLHAQASFTACAGGAIKGELERGASGLTSHVKLVAGAFPLLARHMKMDGHDFFWLANNTAEWQRPEMLLRGASGAASLWDCETGAIRPVSSAAEAEGSRMKLVFKPYEAYWVAFDSASPVTAGATPAGSLTQPAEGAAVLTVEGPWQVRFDPALQPTVEHPLAPSAELVAGASRPLADWKNWGLERFSGRADYTKIITLDKVGGPLVLDLGRVGQVAEVWINGKSMGQRLWGPYLFDLTGALHPGANELRVRVGNLINNSYGQTKESGLFGPVVLRHAVASPQ